MDYPFEQEARHIASGVNNPGEVRGLFLSGRHVGITATDIRGGLLEELDNFSGPGMSMVFVDSGAFSEVAFGPEGVRVVREIDDPAWMRIFDVYRVVACGYRTRARIVAPDRVGDQAVTLARLERYAAHVQAIAIPTRCGVIVPVQKGAMPMSAFWRRACAILALPGLIAGVPMKKDATSLDDLAELVAALPEDARIHLLGIGPESKRYASAIALINRIRPGADITTDSVTIRRLVGRTNGRGGGPRALTAAQDEARAMGITEPAEIKSHALISQGFAEIDAEKARARALGWRDEGDDDDQEEAIDDDQEDGHPERDQDRAPEGAVRDAAAPRRDRTADQVGGDRGTAGRECPAAGRGDLPAAPTGRAHRGEPVHAHRQGLGDRAEVDVTARETWCRKPCEACREIAAGGYSPGPHADDRDEAEAASEIKPRGEIIPRPTEWPHGLKPTNGDQWARDMAILEADKRTRRGANRPPWLVERVLREAGDGPYVYVGEIVRVAEYRGRRIAPGRFEPHEHDSVDVRVTSSGALRSVYRYQVVDTSNPYCAGCGGWGRYPKCETCGQAVKPHPDDGIDGDELGAIGEPGHA